ncbi:MAG: hypothetical protein WC867_03285 [Candidatus Pacearchaeota archaeon]|jgi:hypothetical protein
MQEYNGVITALELSKKIISEFNKYNLVLQKMILYSDWHDMKSELNKRKEPDNRAPITTSEATSYINDQTEFLKNLIESMKLIERAKVLYELGVSNDMIDPDIKSTLEERINDGARTSNEFINRFYKKYPIMLSEYLISDGKISLEK